MTNIHLLADIGGTNARFALGDGQRIYAIQTLPTADYPTLQDAIRAYLQAKHYRLEESARQLRAHSRDGSLTADFDTADRLTNLHSEIHPT